MARTSRREAYDGARGPIPLGWKKRHCLVTPAHSLGAQRACLRAFEDAVKPVTSRSHKHEPYLVVAAAGSAELSASGVADLSYCTTDLAVPKICASGTKSFALVVTHGGDGQTRRESASNDCRESADSGIASAGFAVTVIVPVEAAGEGDERVPV